MEPKPEVDCCVVDGSSLLHKTVWPLNSTYSDIASHYLKYLNDRYVSIVSEIVVVFDGYDAANSTHEHAHINHGVTMLADINFISPDMLLSVKENPFLHNTRNEIQLIKLISRKLHINGIVSIQADGDPDVLIVKTGVEFVKNGKNTAIAREDTDILMMIKHHWDVDMKDLYFMTTISKRKRNSITMFWSARKTYQQFDHSLILFAHK